MTWSFLVQHPSQISLKTVQLLQQVQLSVVSHNPHPQALFLVTFLSVHAPIPGSKKSKKKGEKTAQLAFI